MKGKSCGFSEGLAGSLGLLSSCKKDLRVPLALPQGSQVSSRAEMGTLGFLSSHCRRNWPHLDLCPETPCSPPVATGILQLLSRFTWEVRSPLELKQRTLLSSRFLTGVSWSALCDLKGITPPIEFERELGIAL